MGYSEETERYGQVVGEIQNKEVNYVENAKSQVPNLRRRASSDSFTEENLQLQEARFNEDLIHERENDIMEITNAILEIHSFSQEANKMVAKQGEGLDLSLIHI
eukprot:TRINITY_DN8850_c0_g1_i1.p2 TRINITY_DN8850_c0_g1~~TRINITY_DN8850_c0_g1_i1.p2  ORF type:complete len:104 (-),score=21.41 TRINITY_DN8850_c0_g1_i1:60-371(-)